MKKKVKIEVKFYNRTVGNEMGLESRKAKWKLALTYTEKKMGLK